MEEKLNDAVWKKKV